MTEPVDQSKTPTQPMGMPAVTVESRLATVERMLTDLTTRFESFADKREPLMAQLHAEMAALRSELSISIANATAEEAKKREALEKRLGDFEAKVDALDEKVTAVDTKTDAQTKILERLDKVFAGIWADPKVRNIKDVALALILAWLLSRATGSLPIGQPAAPAVNIERIAP